MKGLIIRLSLICAALFAVAVPATAFADTAVPSIKAEVKHVGKRKACINVTVNPNGIETFLEVEYQPVGRNLFLNRSLGPVEVSNQDQEVPFILEGLKPNHSYRLRVVAYDAEHVQQAATDYVEFDTKAGRPHAARHHHHRGKH